MQKANDITLAAMKIGMDSLKEGMSPADFSAVVNKAGINRNATVYWNW